MILPSIVLYTLYMYTSDNAQEFCIMWIALHDVDQCGSSKSSKHCWRVQECRTVCRGMQENSMCIVYRLQASGWCTVCRSVQCALLHLPGAGEVLSMRKCSLPCRSSGGVCRSVQYALARRSGNAGFTCRRSSAGAMREACSPLSSPESVKVPL